VPDKAEADRPGGDAQRRGSREWSGDAVGFRTGRNHDKECGWHDVGRIIQDEGEWREKAKKRI
jgi:hypothetical protein